MEEKGMLLYEEDVKQRRTQAELNSNHIGIFVCFLVLVLTWTVYGAQVYERERALYLGIGLIITLAITWIFLVIMDRFIRAEMLQNIPIKIYEKGVLMPRTPLDRIRRKPAFIHDNDLEHVRLVRAHKPDQKDMLIATTKQKKTYIKRYERSSNEPENILENVHISAPQAKISISE